VLPSIVPPRGSSPRTSAMSNSRALCGLMSPSKPSSIPKTSHPYSLMAVFTAARMTALRPGQSPPRVRRPIRCIVSDIAMTSSEKLHNEQALRVVWHARVRTLLVYNTIGRQTP
jgi:hypothetical protein